MKKIFLYIPVFLIIFAACFVPAVSAAGNGGENVILSADKFITSDYFAAGKTVTISGTVNGDVFLAGGNILFDGTINGDLLVTGGSININGNVNGNVRAAGGNVMVGGIISRNLSAAAGNLVIGEKAVIAGNLAEVSGDFEDYGKINGQANLAGGKTTIAGTIGGNLSVRAKQLSLKEGAVINGNMDYASQNEVEIARGAVINGNKSKLADTDYDSYFPDTESKIVNPAFRGAGSALNVIGYSWACLIGYFAIKFFPKRTERMVEILNKSFGRTLGVGFLGLILTPLLIILIALTIIGIPLAILMTFVYLVVIYFAKIWVGYFVGRKLLLKLKMGERRGWALVIGLFIYYVLNGLFIGWLVSFLVTVAGIGVLYREKWEFIRIVKTKNIL